METKKSMLVVAARVPPALIKDIEALISSGEYFCISDVIRQALREFVRKRRGE